MKIPSAGLRPLFFVVVPAILLAMLLSIILAGCQTQDSGTEIPNELRGREFVHGHPTASVAGDAEVRIVPVSHVPGPEGGNNSSNGLIFSARTDGQGEFYFRSVPGGLYNIIVVQDGKASFRDSVAVTGGYQMLPPDTLSAPGILIGTIRLQPQHDARTATVQVLGTQLAVNVEEDGRFRLEGLGEGVYRLRMVTSEDGYTPLYREVYVRSGRSDTLSKPLEPFYSDVPVVEGLQATARNDGTIELHWHRPAYGKIQSYLIYRDPENALEISSSHVGRTSDTFFVDTVYSRIPKPGQHPFQDTASHWLEYRVRIRDMFGEIGPMFGSVVVQANPPARDLMSGVWRPVVGQMDFARRRSASLVVAMDRLWLLGGFGPNSNTLNPEVWSSFDGFNWNQVASPPEFRDSSMSLSFKAVAIGDSLRVVKSAWRSGWCLQLWASGDGTEWKNVVDSIPIPTRYGYEVVEFMGNLWVLGGYDEDGNSLPAYISGNDSDWMEYTKGGPGPIGRLSAAAKGDQLFVLDSAANMWCITGTGAGYGLWRKVKAAPDSGTSLIGRPFLSHGRNMWLLSGPTSVVGLPGSGPNQVWHSPDGANWTQMEAIAPFAARTNAAAASFDGKIWVMGGEAIGEGSTSDIWYFDGD